MPAASSMTVAVTILLCSDPGPGVSSPTVGAKLVPADTYVAKPEDRAIHERTPPGGDATESAHAESQAALKLTMVPDRTGLEFPNGWQISVAGAPPLSRGYSARLEPYAFPPAGEGKRVDLWPGLYVVSAWGPKAAWASERHRVGASGMAHELSLRPVPGRRVRLRIADSSRDVVDGVLLCPPDPFLARRVDALLTDGQVELEMPDVAMTVLLLHGSQIVGVLDVPAGPIGTLSIPATARPDGQGAPTSHADDSISKFTTLVCRGRPDNPVSLAVVPGRFAVSATIGNLAAFSFQARLPTVSGSSAAAERRDIQVAAEVDTPDGGAGPWIGARVDAAYELPCLGSTVAIEFSVGAVSSSGSVHFEAPKDAVVRVRVQDNRFADEVVVERDQTFARARARDRRRERWQFGEAQAEVEMLDPLVGLRATRTDELGQTDVPWTEGCQFLVGMWPGKKYSHPTYLDVVPTAANLPPLVFPSGLPLPRRCVVQLFGASPGFAIRGVFPWGRVILQPEDSEAKAADVLDCDPIRPGNVAILAESLDHRSACVIPIDFRGGGQAQVFRGRVPKGGLQLSTPTGKSCDYVVYASHASIWKPLVSLQAREEPRLVLLSPGEYLLYGEDGSGGAAAERVTIGATVQAVQFKPQDGASVLASAVLADGATLLGATICLRVPTWDAARWIVALDREPGVAGLVIPYGEFGVRAAQRSETSKESTFVANERRVPVKVRLGGSK